MFASISELYTRPSSWLVDHPNARRAVRIGILVAPLALAVFHPCPGHVDTY